MSLINTAKLKQIISPPPPPPPKPPEPKHALEQAAKAVTGALKHAADEVAIGVGGAKSGLGLKDLAKTTGPLKELAKEASSLKDLASHVVDAVKDGVAHAAPEATPPGPDAGPAPIHLSPKAEEFIKSGKAAEYVHENVNDYVAMRKSQQEAWLQ